MMLNNDHIEHDEWIEELTVGDLQAHSGKLGLSWVEDVDGDSDVTVFMDECRERFVKTFM